jgi:hypothetical protein
MFCFASFVSGGDSERHNVKGVQNPAEVHLQMGTIDSIAYVFGLDTSSLRAALERRLVERGFVLVSSLRQPLAASRTLELDVHFPQFVVADGPIMCGVQLTLWQGRTSGTKGRRIWESSGIMHVFVNPRRAVLSIPELSLQGMDAFFAAFASSRSQ